jgi:hypothetical protein
MRGQKKKKKKKEITCVMIYRFEASLPQDSCLTWERDRGSVSAAGRNGPSSISIMKIRIRYALAPDSWGQCTYRRLLMMECSGSKFPKQLSLLLGTGNDVVGRVSGLGARQSTNHGSFPGRNKRFSFLQSVHTASWIHPASCSMGTGDLS